MSLTSWLYNTRHITIMTLCAYCSFLGSISSLCSTSTMGSHQSLLALLIDVDRLHGDAVGEAKIAGQNSGLHLTCSASVCGSGCPRTSQDLTSSITGGLSKGLEPLGGHFGDTRLLPGGDAISMNPAVSTDGEDAP